MKRCRKCGEEKPFVEFYRHVATRDRLRHECKACINALTRARYWMSIPYQRQRSKKYRMEHEKEIAARDKIRAQSPRRKARECGYKAKFKKEHPEVVYARQSVYFALKNGRLMREPCLVCGDNGTQAHHEDYSKPLDVVWLCLKHHMEIHEKRVRT